MAKILFINPVIRVQDKPRHIPYGLAQLVALAIKNSHQVQVFDANAWRPSDTDLVDVLKADNWDVIATGGLVTTYGYIKKIVKYAKQTRPSSLVVLGGGVLTPIPYEIMSFLKEVDIGVVGEGYLTLIELLKAIDEKTADWSGINGIIWRDQSGELFLNPERDLLQDVDSLPFPAWDMFPLDIYFQNSGILLSEESMFSKRRLDIICSYGCKFSCKYCFHLGLSGDLSTKVSETGKRDIVISKTRKIRHHSPEYVVKLVKHAKDRFQVDFVSFLDENFVYLSRNKQWFEGFASQWQAAGLTPECQIYNKSHDPGSCSGIHWGTTAHAALVNNENLSAFKKLGCAYLDFGLESFDDEILKSIGKGATAQLNEEAVHLTMKAGIRPVPNQIIGFPDETFESLLLNVDAWNRLGIQAYPFLATPYPGSEWFYKYKDIIVDQYDGCLESFILDLGDATKITAVISKNFNAVELLGLRELLVNRDSKRIKDYQRIWDKNNCSKAAGQLK